MNVCNNNFANIRDLIRAEMAKIAPYDFQESADISESLKWIDSGAEIFRIAKPDTPPKHLVSYFVLIDGDFILLVDHRIAQLWLPTGGHVEVGEHPRVTVIREAQEELAIDAEFLSPDPLFVSVSETVGRTAGHLDVSLWYALKGDKSSDLQFDKSEFVDVAWFHKDEIPFALSDPQLKRFLKKLYESDLV